MAEQPTCAPPVDVMANSISREAHAKQREETIRANNVQEDIMQASLQCAAGASGPRTQSNKDVCIERLKVSSAISIQKKHVDDIKATINDGYMKSKLKLDGILDQSLFAIIDTLFE